MLQSVCVWGGGCCFEHFPAAALLCAGVGTGAHPVHGALSRGLLGFVLMLDLGSSDRTPRWAAGCAEAVGRRWCHWQCPTTATGRASRPGVCPQAGTLPLKPQEQRAMQSVEEGRRTQVLEDHALLGRFHWHQLLPQAKTGAGIIYINSVGLCGRC